MKKLMIAAAIVCATVVAQAATANWNWACSGAPAATKQIWWDNGDSAKLAENTAIYLFDAGVVSQDDILTGLRDGTKKTLADFTSINHSSINSDNKLTAVNGFGYGTQSTEAGDVKYSFYMAAIDAAGNIFLSDSVDVVAAGTDNPKSVSFSGINGPTQKSYTSDATAVFGGDGGKGAGWYAAAPEPTSGLLLLLGVAGLALRRRRA